MDGEGPQKWMMSNPVSLKGVRAIIPMAHPGGHNLLLHLDGGRTVLMESVDAVVCAKVDLPELNIVRNGKIHRHRGEA